MFKTCTTSSLLAPTFTPVDTITSLLYSFFVVIFLGCVYNSIAID